MDKLWEDDFLNQMLYRSHKYKRPIQKVPSVDVIQNDHLEMIRDHPKDDYPDVKNDVKLLLSDLMDKCVHLAVNRDVHPEDAPRDTPGQSDQAFMENIQWIQDTNWISGILTQKRETSDDKKTDDGDNKRREDVEEDHDDDDDDDQQKSGVSCSRYYSADHHLEKEEKGQNGMSQEKFEEQLPNQMVEQNKIRGDESTPGKLEPLFLSASSQKVLHVDPVLNDPQDHHEKHTPSDESDSSCLISKSTVSMDLMPVDTDHTEKKMIRDDDDEDTTAQTGGRVSDEEEPPDDSWHGSSDSCHLYDAKGHEEDHLRQVSSSWHPVIRPSDPEDPNPDPDEDSTPGIQNAQLTGAGVCQDEEQRIQQNKTHDEFSPSSTPAPHPILAAGDAGNNQPILRLNPQTKSLLHIIPNHDADDHHDFSSHPENSSPLLSPIRKKESSPVLLTSVCSEDESDSDCNEWHHKDSTRGKKTGIESYGIPPVKLVDFPPAPLKVGLSKRLKLSRTLHPNAKEYQAVVTRIP